VFFVFIFYFLFFIKKFVLTRFAAVQFIRSWVYVLMDFKGVNRLAR
jgi:hypothetical protein